MPPTRYYYRKQTWNYVMESRTEVSGRRRIYYIVMETKTRMEVSRRRRGRGMGLAR